MGGMFKKFIYLDLIELDWKKGVRFRFMIFRMHVLTSSNVSCNFSFIPQSLSLPVVNFSILM